MKWETRGRELSQHVFGGAERTLISAGCSIRPWIAAPLACAQLALTDDREHGFKADCHSPPTAPRNDKIVNVRATLKSNGEASFRNGRRDFLVLDRKSVV